MKAIARWMARPIWLVTGPARRSVMGWFDARVVRLVAETVESRMLPPIAESLSNSEDRLARIEDLVARAERSASRMAEEVDVVLDGLSREVFRLQAKVDGLRDDLAGEGRPAVAGLAILADPDDDPTARADRSRVG